MEVFLHGVSILPGISNTFQDLDEEPETLASIYARLFRNALRIINRCQSTNNGRLVKERVETRMRYSLPVVKVAC